MLQKLIAHRSLFIVLIFAPVLLFAQKSAKPFENQVFADDIRTVQLHAAGAQLSFPSANVGAANGTLLLEFDVMSGDLKDYWYTIIHCNADWTPSNLETNEYIDGYPEDRILDWQTSLNTLADYTHYTLALPNRNMRWTLSGNYILKVWEDDADATLVMTRRFMIVEPSWRVEAQFVRPATVSKQDTHHEIDFTVVHAGTRVTQPQQDINVYVMQNLRWDNVLGPAKPFTARGTELVFDYQDKITFPAGKEFRFFDISQFDFRDRNVAQIAELDDYYEVTLKPERNYSNQVYQYWGDLNGRFSVENKVAGQTLRQCDYAKVLFSLKQEIPLDDLDVYVFGELTDWQLKPEFKMEHDPEAKVYWCEPLLKQGFYNYEIVAVDRKTGQLRLDEFNGNWYETGNQYTILVYYRPYGERYDRLMAAATFESRQRN